MSRAQHHCDHHCECPIHHVQLYYSEKHDQHACPDRSCEYAAGMPTPFPPDCRRAHLPAWPQGVRASPDGLTVALLYDSPVYGRRWVGVTCRDGEMDHELRLLDSVDVQGWTEWSANDVL